MSVSLERLARNQALFREVNERLLELARFVVLTRRARGDHWMVTGVS